MAAVKQERVLSKNPEIVVATPGRLWELIQQGNSHLSNIENIRLVQLFFFNLQLCSIPKIPNQSITLFY